MYTGQDKMAYLIGREPEALQVISRFNLPLGVGEKTIAEVCEEHNIHTLTFLTIINYKAGDSRCSQRGCLSCGSSSSWCGSSAEAHSDSAEGGPLLMMKEESYERFCEKPYDRPNERSYERPYERSFERSYEIPYEELSLHTLVEYLQNAHTYFFDFSLPMLRQKLIESINLAGSRANTSDEAYQIPVLIIKFFDEWVSEINTHMRHENERLFPYVESLLRGERPVAENVDKYEHQHSLVDDTHIASKLTELKNMIIRYYPAMQNADGKAEPNNLLNSALYDIFQHEQDLATHCAIEDNILLPAVRLLEKRTLGVKVDKNHKAEEVDENKDGLSERERDVVIQVVRGLSNKEIADVLCISPHTVISHRKNIAAKLNIHSTAGLTIYAIVNKLVDIHSLQV